MRRPATMACRVATLEGCAAPWMPTSGRAGPSTASVRSRPSNSHGCHYDPSIQPSTLQTSCSGGDSNGRSMSANSPDLSAALNRDAVA